MVAARREPSAVVAERLVKRYDATVALGDVSFEVQQGELFGFIGPDGRGKRTLIRILAQLRLPASRSAGGAGRDVVRGSGALRTGVG